MTDFQNLNEILDKLKEIKNQIWDVHKNLKYENNFSGLYSIAKIDLASAVSSLTQASKCIQEIEYSRKFLPNND